VRPVPQVPASRSGSDVDTPAHWLEARTYWRAPATCQPCPTSRTHSGAFRPDGSRRAYRRMRPQKRPERPKNNQSCTARKWLVNAAFLLERSTDRRDRQTKKRKPQALSHSLVFPKLFRMPTNFTRKLIIHSKLDCQPAKRTTALPGAISDGAEDRSHGRQSISKCGGGLRWSSPTSSLTMKTRAAISLEPHLKYLRKSSCKPSKRTIEKLRRSSNPHWRGLKKLA